MYPNVIASTKTAPMTAALSFSAATSYDDILAFTNVRLWPTIFLLQQKIQNDV